MKKNPKSFDKHVKLFMSPQRQTERISIAPSYNKQLVVLRQWAEWNLTRTALQMNVIDTSLFGVLSQVVINSRDDNSSYLNRQVSLKLHILVCY